MRLNQLADNDGARHVRKRVGRGIGSGLGKTSGRGQKGQGARAGIAIATFEGGQMPLHRRLPQRGFKNPSRLTYSEVNLGRLQAAVDAGRIDAKQTVDAKALVAAGLIRRPLDGVRLLAQGELKAALTISVAGASKAAAEAVAKAGGTLQLPPRKEKPANAKGKRRDKKNDKKASKTKAAESGE